MLRSERQHNIDGANDGIPRCLEIRGSYGTSLDGYENTGGDY